jgi:curved DNA-binding protein CbpA
MANNIVVRKAWRSLSLQLHPDKIRNPAQLKNTTEATKLVNAAYEELYKNNKDMYINRETHGTDHRYKAHWLNDRSINRGEWQRREQENNFDICRDPGFRKPWFRPYKMYKECAEDGSFFCEAYWVNFAHD